MAAGQMEIKSNARLLLTDKDLKAMKDFSSLLEPHLYSSEKKVPLH